MLRRKVMLVVGGSFSLASEFVYVANHLSNNVSGFTINPKNGALTPISGSPFAGLSPLSVATTAGENSQ